MVSGTGLADFNADLAKVEPAHNTGILVGDNLYSLLRARIKPGTFQLVGLPSVTCQLDVLDSKFLIKNDTNLPIDGYRYNP